MEKTMNPQDPVSQTYMIASFCSVGSLITIGMSVYTLIFAMRV